MRQLKEVSFSDDKNVMTLEFSYGEGMTPFLYSIWKKRLLTVLLERKERFIVPMLFGEQEINVAIGKDDCERIMAFLAVSAFGAMSCSFNGY